MHQYFYQAITIFPFGAVATSCTDSKVVGVFFLGKTVESLKPKNELAQEVERQLLAYLADPQFQFDLPLESIGTKHQQCVWHEISATPSGRTINYGELAKRIGSSAQAVGQACGANPWPIIVSCHRVVAKSGLGGFANQCNGDLLDVKQWLLTHESK